ncbi:MAG TPA: hypothetical protein VJA94_00390 [Candidatus Angelobacter sp.]
MGWIEDHFRAGNLEQSQTNDFAPAARRRWLMLGDELRADVSEFNLCRGGAEVSQPADNQFLVINANTGMQLTIQADFEARAVRYDFSQINGKSAGAPEGGMLSMRQSRKGDVEFYSADERLTSEETRKVLLEPMLFPPEMAA